ncbi:hypothetical protein GH5_08408 [Leishmania sp. Ghana 2012 LV757]|uniref:hypothetical protein n=1 Tax=Leishmania sp. Ghana 2012 LV757 TaxID=2803181 RepID=UPI001B7764A1|nr:hypothetical protein GH5_08408 [Leishmania sp. Ghana 2012 LV757]
MEEAAQEVRRILRQNDVEEALHYLSTVTRSIEANQHDLRAIIGNSYRDLLNACDGVVGMEQDCADILTIEEAIERVGAEHDIDSRGNTEVDAEPLLPPSWFSARLRRQRRAAAAAVTTTIRSHNASFATPSRRSATKGYTVTNGGRRGERTRDAEAAAAAAADATAAAAAAAAREGYDVNAKRTGLHPASALPIVELPLPYVVPAGPNIKGTPHSAVVDEDTSTGTLAAQRMRLGDELQALHLDYMTLAAATASMAEGTAAVDAELRSLLSNSSTLASLSLPAHQHGEVPDSLDACCTARAASYRDAGDAVIQKKREDILCSLERDLPLLRLARRLSRVQASLRVYAGGSDGVRSSACAGDAATASSAALAGLSANRMSLAKRPPSWVAGFERRATTLEVRLVKLILQRLRRAAHSYAWLAEQRNRFARQSSKHSSGAESAQSSAAAKAMRAAENRFLVYVWVIFAQCHGAVRALRDSPTLVNALVACVPGAALPVKRALLQAMQGTAPAVSSAANMSLGSAADALFHLASGDVRTIVSVVMHGATPLASARAGPTAGDTVLSCAADPCRMLLAFLAVLLLRESQLSAMRWAAAAPSCLSAVSSSTVAQPETVADASSQLSSFLPDDRVGTQSTVAAASGKLDCSRSEGDVALLSPSTAPPEPSVFATATHLSAVGLAAAAAGGSETPTTTTVTAGNEIPNTAWALRCFSGLSYLLRAFADYVDLVQAASVAVPSAPEALDEETTVLRLLQGVCLAEEADSEDQLWPADHSSGVAVGKCQDGEQSLFTPPIHAAGARSLDELLQWRLRNAGGCVVASSAAEDSSSTPLVSLTATDASVLSPLVGSNGLLMTPVRGLYSVAAANAEPGAVLQSAAAARRRAYVELLRASVNTVDELQAISASSATADERSHSVRADSAVTGAASAASGATDLLSPLRFVCQELLAPCVSSLVILLARDPVALAVHNGGQSCSDTTPARHAVRDALRRLIQHSVQRRALSGTPGPRRPFDISCLGQTWATIDEARWWELMEQATMNAALQRCVTVALESVSFVDICVAQGLVASAFRMLQSSADANNTELGERVSSSNRGGTAHHSDTAASALERTWSALFAVLRLHALSSGDPVSKAGEAGTYEGAEGGSGAGAEQRSTHRFIGGTSSVPVRGNCGRRADGESLMSSMTGICWDRFRSPTATRVANSTRRSLRTTLSEGMFREEGLEWGRAACRAAQLPFSAMCGVSETGRPRQTVDAAAASAGLSASQQAQLAKILSVMRDTLFPTSEASCCAEHDTDSDTRPGALHMNGHAAELLQRCLLALVDAVQAQTAAAQTLATDVSARLMQSAPPPLHMRIVGWLEDALHRVALQLRDAETGAPPSGANASVVHSYELSLLVRVYSMVLQRLQTVTLPSEAARVQQLCAEAEALYERTQAPWQDMLIRCYRAALQQVYASLLRPREGGEDEPGHSAASSRSGAALRRLAYVTDSTAWVRVPRAGQVPLHDSSASESPGVAYPAQPTPALMTLTQAVLRHLHQALYGAPSVFGDSPAPLMSFESNDGAHSGVAAVSGKEQGAAASATASAGFSGASTRRLCALVTEKEQQRVRARVAAASAELYESELCSLIDVADESGGSALQKGDAAPAVNAATQSQADDMRLQWYMDVLFTASVWCAGSENAGGGDGSSSNNNSAGLLWREADSPAKALFESHTGVGGVPVDAAACVADGPLRRVVCRLESTCDPVRWRSGVPLVLTAYRQFISASALLWVVRSEEPPTASLGGTHRDEVCRSPSVAAAAAAKPFVAAGGAAAASFSTERFLHPREHVDRLALLPIAVSSNAALAAAASMGAGGAPSAAAASASALGPPSYSLLPPTASALNPHSPSSTSSTSVPPTRPYRFGGSSSAVAAAMGAGRGAGVPSFMYPAGGCYDASNALMLDGVGAADVIGTGGATAAAGSSSAAAAASLLWGTTQRGWNQLWGTR